MEKRFSFTSLSPHVRAALLWVAASVLLWSLVVWSFGAGGIGPLPEVAPVSPDESSSVESSEETGLTVPDRMRRGDTLSSVLARNGLTAAEVHEVARALAAVMDVRHLREGDGVSIEYGSDGRASSIWVHHGDFELVHLVRSEPGWQSEWTKIDLERRTVVLYGVLEDNLFLSMARLGESAPLTVAFANVFSWDFDFHSQSRQGDRFSLVVDKLYREGEAVGYGELHVARYVSTLSGERVFDAFLYEDPTGLRDYYDRDGKSLKKAFLRAPVDFDRISSGFSYNRLHPVHKRRMPHLGVDYAARKGTPVYSVANGVVVGRGFEGGGGNTVTVRHAMGFTSKYLHLSAFARGLSVGKRVDQKEVIGYVGDTGTATAPHLDFRLLHHGKPVNPLTQIFPPGPPVADEFRDEFEARKSELEKKLGEALRRAPILTDG
jgi:murein DD-endopeptidase MepM/ murein hydrolase activator NlpD